VARARLGDDGQRDRALVGRGGEIGGADGVTVHRRVVESRYRLGALDRLGQHSAERLAHRNRLRSERRRSVEHQPARLVDLGQLPCHGFFAQQRIRRARPGAE
jgi:hypothetical protein